MKSFQQDIYDLYGLHFPDDLYDLLIEFIPSEYVDQILACCLSNKLIEPVNIIIPKKYFECDWNALFRHDFLLQQSNCILYYIPDTIRITYIKLHSLRISDSKHFCFGYISFSAKKYYCMYIVDLTVYCVATGRTILHDKNYHKPKHVNWHFIIK